MYEQILKQMRAAAAARRVYLVIHANKELKNDRLTYEDVVHCILTGEIIEQQIDLERNEEKYVLYGDACNGNEMGVIAKLGYNNTAVIITVYRLTITDYDF